ncbi:AraC family transcriptional regulator [Ferrovibrio terrae]|uniref:AraC family transcriptional regulator n=1 Tax=Ferrovibrio terrae TaxID=2594003 RepID=UPI003137EBD7
MNQMASVAARPQVLLSSRGRDWSHLYADLLAMPGGPVTVLDSKQTMLSVHVGAPLRVRCRIGDGPREARLLLHGDIDILPAGASGEWFDEAPTTALVLRLAPDLLSRAAAELGLSRATLSPQAQLRDPRLVHLAWAIRAELSNGDARGRLYADSLGMALAVQLLRGEGAPADAAGSGRGLAPAQRRRVADHIAAHLEDDLSVDALSRLAGLGATQFKTLFRQSFGLPVHQYVIRRRVEQAKLLLLQGRMGLAEIALAAGFAHQSHMARSMRRLLGVSPAQVRRTAD